MTEQEIVSLMEILENATKWLDRYGVIIILGFVLVVSLVGTVIKTRRKIKAIKTSEEISEEKVEIKKKDN